MFAGDSFTDKKLSDSIDTSDSLLRQLKPNETAMSVTVRSLANGLSGKLQQGDIIQIVSVDEDDKAQIYEELQYVEVLATTSDKARTTPTATARSTRTMRTAATSPSTLL